MKGDLFSIITVVYNDLEGLLNTKESLDNQSNQFFEWILIDGNSTDGSAEEVKGLVKTQSKVKGFSESDTGIYDAMNKGKDLAKGEYIVFMNAGDIFSNNEVLQLVANKVSNLKNLDIVMGGSTLIFPAGKKHYRSPKTIDYMWHGLPASHQSIYFRKEILTDIQYDLKYKICGDYYLMSRILESSEKSLEIECVDSPLVDFRVGDTSYKNPLLIMKEPYLIQRDVLKKTLVSRLLSLGKRMISTLGFVIFSHAKINQSK